MKLFKTLTQSWISAGEQSTMILQLSWLQNRKKLSYTNYGPKMMEIYNTLIKEVHLSKLSINNASHFQKYIKKRFP